MSASFRPTEVREGDILIVRGIRGQDFGDDTTHWGEHMFKPGDIIKVLKVIPPRTEVGWEAEYAFYCEGSSSGGPVTQTLTADEIVGSLTNDIEVVEEFLNTR